LNWFAIVPDYGNEYTAKENKNLTSFKNFAPKLNLNHNKIIQGDHSYDASSIICVINNNYYCCFCK